MGGSGQVGGCDRGGRNEEVRLVKDGKGRVKVGIVYGVDRTWDR